MVQELKDAQDRRVEERRDIYGAECLSHAIRSAIMRGAAFCGFASIGGIVLL
jgi:hypothetical protein